MQERISHACATIVSPATTLSRLVMLRQKLRGRRYHKSSQPVPQPQKQCQLSDSLSGGGTEIILHLIYFQDMADRIPSAAREELASKPRQQPPPCLRCRGEYAVGLYTIASIQHHQAVPHKHRHTGSHIFHLECVTTDKSRRSSQIQSN